MVMFTQGFYIAMVLIVVAVLIIAFLVFSFLKKPKSNDFDVRNNEITQVNTTKNSPIRKNVKTSPSVRRLMPK